MQKQITLKLLPSEAIHPNYIQLNAAKHLGITPESISGFHIFKRSVDARGKQPMILLTIRLYIAEPFLKRRLAPIFFKDVFHAQKKVIIVGAGPAGIFAALKLIENGIQPILLERGKDVRNRRRDLAILNKEGQINPESNYCFGEGGAGTYSDGKLYTRSTKRGDVSRILNIFIQFGAEENVLYEAHPHIGTNKLPQIISAMREKIIECGGKFLFDKKVVDLLIQNQSLKGVKTSDGNLFETDSLILATCHSARDVFELLHNKSILVEFKPFALGVRVEHPQKLIDTIQYHCNTRDKYLPPASYSLVEQVNERGVFSFCMCPGGIIAPSSTDHGELVLNGWSPSKRNNPFANSGIVVSVGEKDVGSKQLSKNPLAGVNFQRSVEKKAFIQGGGNFVAPAQRMTDFVANKISTSLPACSYLPGIHSTRLKEVLPAFVYFSLCKAFVEFGRKLKGYYSEEAVVVATESRTSSPVRIPRDIHSFQHSQVKGLFPCGEGAGYAGGIVSAAMDGEKVATAIIERSTSY